MASLTLHRPLINDLSGPHVRVQSTAIPAYTMVARPCHHVRYNAALGG